MSVSDIPYPGNARSRPRPLASGIPGIAFWWCDLADDPASPTAPLAAWLSTSEHARTSRFGNEALARRYVRGRAALRWVLARQLAIEPQQVPITAGARGRPHLHGQRELDFNISNTRTVALIGVATSPGIRIGVDVEHENRSLHHAALARKFLTPREQAAIASEDSDAHRRAFLRLWTCKEAMSKATGEALSAPLRRLDVAVGPELALVDGPAPYTPEQWLLAAVDTPDGYLGTAAIWRPSAPGAATE